jgi:hypothetical protein
LGLRKKQALFYRNLKMPQRFKNTDLSHKISVGKDDMYTIQQIDKGWRVVRIRMQTGVVIGIKNFPDKQQAIDHLNTLKSMHK